MSNEELNVLLHDIVSARVKQGEEKYNTLRYAPVYYEAMSSTFPKELCESFKNAVFFMCILHPEWNEAEILHQVSEDILAGVSTTK
jgi:hypothetical protein